MSGLPVVSSWPPPRFCGTGGSPTTRAVYPPKATAYHLDSVVRAIQPSLTGGLPVEIFVKVVPSHFRIPAGLLR
ncbi:hypothetical protein B296_00023697 [Ensete ventricosum]|uniref:Uncharacterized protein n=1 Tax=Ensete ventricosum TaxID=4639 RepID=A0A426ZQP2_ENSVE|nr:hypothetical protein B296_00023697 [Ensete ventricosum]